MKIPPIFSKRKEDTASTGIFTSIKNTVTIRHPTKTFDTPIPPVVKEQEPRPIEKSEKNGITGEIPFILGASVTGSAHKTKCVPCQDAARYSLFHNQWALIAVADGLGSAKWSELGAGLATETAVASMKIALDGQSVSPSLIVEEAIFAARKSLEIRSEDSKCEIGDLACTLIVVLANPETCAVAHIGDGAVVLQSGNELILLSEPEKSEYINETTPLTNFGWKEKIRFGEVSTQVTFVAAFTDGCQRAALVKEKGTLIPFSGFFSPIYTFAQGLDSCDEGEQELRLMLESEKMRQQSSDDKTFVIAILGREEKNENSL